MQIVYLGARRRPACLSCSCMVRSPIKYHLLLILILWGEHGLVFACGKSSLDNVPILGLMFGLGIDHP
jgi:hypothetical protein